MKRKASFHLKDQLFNEEKVGAIAREITSVYPTFNAEDFVRSVVVGFPSRELKERIVWIRENLRLFLPENYRDACSILLSALPPILDPDKKDDDFGDFIYAPYSDFVATYGCSKKELLFSLSALKEMTKRFSVEDAIRYFLRAYPDQTLSALKEWSNDDNYHVRRLVSEGTRPRLPWSEKVELDQKKTVALLDLLHSDETRYVVRSVANHMNDISKQDPKIVLKILKAWKAEGRQSQQELDYMISHALRTLIKRGDIGAFALLRYKANPMISVREFSVTPSCVALGEAVTFTFAIVAKKDERLMIDYVITFIGKDGRISREKVFKLARVEIMAGTTRTFTKAHLLKPMTTWSLYAGEHRVALQINGIRLTELNFELII